MNTKHLLFLIIPALFYYNLEAQVLGEKPNQQNWQEISTKTGRFIYPKNIEKKAFQTAKFLEALENKNPLRLKSKKRNLGILIQNKGLESNGYVALRPFRSAFYTTAAQSANLLGSNEWMRFLAIHEERHIQQYNHSLRGLSKIGYFLSGESGWSFFQRLSIPNWFFEGDAILSETALTKAGRGRLAHFSLFQRSIARNGKPYDYHKIRNGSFKDLVPNHYRWGYTMMATLTEEKGHPIVGPVLKDAASYRFVFYPFSQSLKKHSGYTTKSLYQKSWEKASKAWKAQLKDRELIKTKGLTDSILKTVSYYHFPQFVTDSSFVALKTTNKKTATIVFFRKNEKSKNIVRPGFSVDPFFHYKEGYLVWTEQSMNPRRTAETYENIILYDMKNADKKRLTKKGRYFSPLVLPKDSLVYAIRYHENQHSLLVKINLKDKKEKIIHQFPSSSFISRLTIDEEGESLAYIKKKGGNLAIYSYSLKTGAELQLTPWTAHAIDAPKIAGDFIYYDADFNQINNLYKSPLDGSLAVIQLSEVPLGAYQVDVNPKRNRLIFKEGILNGYQLSSLQLSKSKNKSIKITEPLQQQWIYKHLNHDITAEIPWNLPDSSSFNSTNHRGLLKGFRLHSWPITASPAVQEINFQFDNYLHNISANLGGGYNYNEKGSFYRAEVSYGKWFPIINLWAGYNHRYIDQLGVLQRFSKSKFRQKSVGTEVRIPLQWQQGNFSTKLSLNLGLSRSVLSNNAEQYSENFELAKTGFNFSIKRRKATQQLASPLGLRSTINYSRSIAQLANEKFQSNIRLFLPSIFKTHSLQLAFGFKRELEENIYQHIDQFAYARGYNYPFSDEYKLYSIDYQLPLFYPDWGFWGISYFKRIRANLFLDYAENKVFWFNENYNLLSTGAGLYFDNHFFNHFPISFGLRSSYRIKDTPFETSANPWSYSIMISNFF